MKCEVAQAEIATKESHAWQAAAKAEAADPGAQDRAYSDNTHNISPIPCNYSPLYNYSPLVDCKNRPKAEKILGYFLLFWKI